ncbi:collagen alpha-1(III) chain-like [Caloenas nicobarica]|uniref:collagen alpha-1(III) chain-like n=1 Tax=Caloenas nicobarica TaxID=187106 RepID=UPI0032B87841
MPGTPTRPRAARGGHGGTPMRLLGAAGDPQRRGVPGSVAVCRAPRRGSRLILRSWCKGEKGKRESWRSASRLPIRARRGLRRRAAAPNSSPADEWEGREERACAGRRGGAGRWCCGGSRSVRTAPRNPPRHSPRPRLPIGWPPASSLSITQCKQGADWPAPAKSDDGPGERFQGGPGAEGGGGEPGGCFQAPPVAPPRPGWTPRPGSCAGEIKGGGERGTGRSRPAESPSGSAALPADIRLQRSYSLRWDDNRVRRASGWGTQRSPWGPCGTAQTDLRTPGHTDAARSRTPGDRARGQAAGTDGRGQTAALRGSALARAMLHGDVQPLCEGRGAGSAAGVSAVGSSAQPGFLLQPAAAGARAEPCSRTWAPRKTYHGERGGRIPTARQASPGDVYGSAEPQPTPGKCSKTALLDPSLCGKGQEGALA